MFAVIYKATLKPGLEEEYKRSWQTVAQYFIEHRGALGSCLHKAEDGTWIAYSRWPDSETRAASWGDQVDLTILPPEIRCAVQSIKDCIEESYPEICMEVVNDLLTESCFELRI